MRLMFVYLICFTFIPGFMAPHTAFEFILVGAAFKKLVDTPVKTFDTDMGVRTDFPLTAETSIGRVNDDLVKIGRAHV